MPTSSFSKEFKLIDKKAVDSFYKIISSPIKNKPINRNLITIETQKKAEAKLKKMLSQENNNQKK
ncbi:hypothetical protein [Senegalia massiliensis]|uniref:Uncharacterized protein n=1 Tax=Senegalia massiliensis TaxID=1720316 RepID=A0A845QWE2_9CLOT|nr:hypothetical protein [Senegalia massiliensis]NBI06109.1 hypothetical protein [Senegalia massiliensis]